MLSLGTGGAWWDMRVPGFNARLCFSDGWCRRCQQFLRQMFVRLMSRRRHPPRWHVHEKIKPVLGESLWPGRRGGWRHRAASGFPADAALSDRPLLLHVVLTSEHRLRILLRSAAGAGECVSELWVPVWRGWERAGQASLSGTTGVPFKQVGRVWRSLRTHVAESQSDRSSDLIVMRCKLMSTLKALNAHMLLADSVFDAPNFQLLLFGDFFFLF